MNLIPTYNTGLAQYHQGLGFLGIKLGKWLKKGLDYAVDVIGSAIKTYVPIIGGSLSEKWIKMAQAWTASLEQYIDGLNGVADGEVTPYEELILNDWLYYYFTPFLQSLVKNVASAMELPSNGAKIVALNGVLNKINAVQDHYAVADNEELSANAIDQRRYLIFSSFQPIVEAVKLSVESLNIDVSIVPVSFSLTSYDYSPLFTSSIVTTVKGDNFKINTGTIKVLPTPGAFESVDFTKWNTKKPPVIDLTKNTGVVPPVTTPITTVPVVTKPPIKVPVINPTAPEVIPPVTPPVTLPTSPGNNPGSSTKEETTNFSPKTEKKTNTVYYWLGAALIAGAILVKSNKDSKGKKANPKTTTGRKPAKK